MSRIRRWFAATHGARFELVRHFLGGFFESDLVTSPGEWVKTAAGAIGVLASLFILMLQIFSHRYGCLEQAAPSFFCPAVADYRGEYLHLVRVDTLWLIGLACCLTALLTAVQWQSLFPTLRDCLALAGYPVSPREIFASKLASVTLVFAGFVLVLNVAPALVFSWIASGRWSEHAVLAQAASIFLGMTAGCVVVFFGMLAIQGLLLNLLPPRLFERVSVYAQVILFTANVAALPFLWGQPAALWWPPNWFLGLGKAVLGASDPAAQYALYAVAGVPMLALLTYVAGYHRYQKLLLEAPAAGSRKGFEPPEWVTGSDAHEKAMFLFMWKTLTRSRLHQLVLQVCAGLAIAWMVGSGGLKSGGAVPVVVVPLTFAGFAIVGLRYLFSIPTELRANWIFQTTESEGRVSWLRAVDRFVMACALAPLYACSLPAAVAVFGWWQAVRVTVLGLFVALLVFEFFFRHWDKAPFTCSYLPGKRQAWQFLLAALVGLSFLGVALVVVAAFGSGWVPFAAAFPLLFAVWRRLRRRRMEDWPETALVYDEQPEPAVASLHLDFENDQVTLEPSVAGNALRPAFWNREEPERDAAPFFGPSGFTADVRYGLRMMRKNYGLSATVVATLALGLGMNVSVFTTLNAIAFRPRVPDPDSFVRVSPVHSGDGMSAIGGVTNGDYKAYRDGNRSLKMLAAWYRANLSVENDRSAAAPILLVSCNFFSVYGTERPLLGRFFRADECAAPGQAPVAVIAEEEWRDRFGADPQILGRAITIDDQHFTVIGVAPALSAARLNGNLAWIPYTAAPLLTLGFDPFGKPVSWLMLEGRLAHGVSRATAEAELSVLAHQLDEQNVGRKTSLLVTDGSLLSVQTTLNAGGAARFLGYWTILFLTVALGMVLCISCANVMTLLLSRAVARRREIAVRLSLGAHRLRLLRMLLVEGLFLALAAGGITVYVSYQVPPLLFQFLTHHKADFPIEPDWRIFMYIFGVAIVAGCLSALAPALESLKVNLTESLKGYHSTASDGTSGVLRTVLVTAQVALSLALLVGAGIFLHGYWRLYRVNPGYDARHVLVAPLRFPSGFTQQDAKALADAALERLRALPGVTSVARTNGLPILDFTLASAAFADHVGSATRTVSLQPGAPGLLRTLGVGLARGRDFRETDGPSVIVSEKLAQTMLPGVDPLGRVLTVGVSSYEVIGVVRNVEAPINDSPVALRFEGWSTRQAYLAIHFSGDERAAQNAVREAIRAVRSDILVTPRTLQSWVDDGLDTTWRVVVLILGLGVLAMALAVAGIYGVISFTVSQRTRELGIRVALGAAKVDIYREVLMAGSRPVLLGLFAGVWLSLLVDSAIHNVFLHAPFQTEQGNPVIYLGAALVLGLAALAAMVIPAGRGARSDPMKSLHYE